MKNSSIEYQQRTLYPQLQELCNFLNQGHGGFVGLFLSILDGPPPMKELSEKAKQANQGRQLYPQLQYLCDFLNSGQRL